MNRTVIHWAQQNTQRCDFRTERLNAHPDLAEVTCRNCLRLHAEDCERNVAFWMRYAEQGLPPVADSEQWRERGWPTTREGCRERAATWALRAAAARQRLED